MALELGHSTGSIGGEEALGQGVIDTMKLVVDKVRGVIVPGKGHWLAEQEPQQLVDVLTRSLPSTGTLNSDR